VARGARWRGVRRSYDAEDVVRLRGTISWALGRRLTADKLWALSERPFVNALGALTGNQAMQQVKAGLDAIYLSGWQVAGDANPRGDVPGSVAVSGGFGYRRSCGASTTPAPRG